MLRLAFTVFAFAVDAFTILCLIRILISWVSPENRPGWVSSGEGALGRITDWYLDLFRAFRRARVGPLDLSPVFALIVLGLLSMVFHSLASSGYIRLGSVLAFILSSLWSIVAFLLFALILLLVLRLILWERKLDETTLFWSTVRSLTDPFLRFLNGTLYRGRIVRFRSALVTGIAILGALWLLGSAGTWIAIISLERLPF